MTKALPARVVLIWLLTAAFACWLSPANTEAMAQSERPRQKEPARAASDAPPARLLKRTTTRRELRAFGYGGTLTVYGAPEGSVTIEAWTRAQVEITVDIELQAETEEDLALLAEVNRFHLDEDFNHFRVLTLGTHDARYLKQVARKLPKRLLGLPWRVDYRIRVPAVTDLELYTGRGPINLNGVVGAVRLRAGAGNATFELAGGDFEATLAGGPVIVRVPARGWRGRGMTLRLATGDLTIELPASFNGEVGVDVLRTGRIENNYPGLSPSSADPDMNDRVLRARAGAGGAPLSFTVGDGNVRIVQVGDARNAPTAEP